MDSNFLTSLQADPWVDSMEPLIQIAVSILDQMKQLSQQTNQNTNVWNLVGYIALRVEKKARR